MESINAKQGDKIQDVIDNLATFFAVNTFVHNSYMSATFV